MSSLPSSNREYQQMMHHKLDLCAVKAIKGSPDGVTEVLSERKDELKPMDYESALEALAIARDIIAKQQIEIKAQAAEIVHLKEQLQCSRNRSPEHNDSVTLLSGNAPATNGNSGGVGIGWILDQRRRSVSNASCHSNGSASKTPSEGLLMSPPPIEAKSTHSSPTNEREASLPPSTPPQAVEAITGPFGATMRSSPDDVSILTATLNSACTTIHTEHSEIEEKGTRDASIKSVTSKMPLLSHLKQSLSYSDLHIDHPEDDEKGMTTKTLTSTSCRRIHSTNTANLTTPYASTGAVVENTASDGICGTDCVNSAASKGLGQRLKKSNSARKLKQAKLVDGMADTQLSVAVSSTPTQMKGVTRSMANSEIKFFWKDLESSPLLFIIHDNNMLAANIIKNTPSGSGSGMECMLETKDDVSKHSAVMLGTILYSGELVDIEDNGLLDGELVLNQRGESDISAAPGTGSSIATSVSNRGACCIVCKPNTIAYKIDFKALQRNVQQAGNACAPLIRYCTANPSKAINSDIIEFDITCHSMKNMGISTIVDVSTKTLLKEYLFSCKNARVDVILDPYYTLECGDRKTGSLSPIAATCSPLDTLWLPYWEAGGGPVAQNEVINLSACRKMAPQFRSSGIGYIRLGDDMSAYGSAFLSLDAGKSFVMNEGVAHCNVMVQPDTPSWTGFATPSPVPLSRQFSGNTPTPNHNGSGGPVPGIGYVRNTVSPHPLNQQHVGQYPHTPLLAVPSIDLTDLGDMFVNCSVVIDDYLHSTGPVSSVCTTATVSVPRSSAGYVDTGANSGQERAISSKYQDIVDSMYNCLNTVIMYDIANITEITLTSSALTPHSLVNPVINFQYLLLANRPRVSITDKQVSSVWAGLYDMLSKMKLKNNHILCAGIRTLYALVLMVSADVFLGPSMGNGMNQSRANSSSHKNRNGSNHRASSGSVDCSGYQLVVRNTMVLLIELLKSSNKQVQETVFSLLNTQLQNIALDHSSASKHKCILMSVSYITSNNILQELFGDFNSVHSKKVNINTVINVHSIKLLQWLSNVILREMELCVYNACKSVVRAPDGSVDTVYAKSVPSIISPTTITDLSTMLNLYKYICINNHKDAHTREIVYATIASLYVYYSMLSRWASLDMKADAIMEDLVLPMEINGGDAESFAKVLLEGNATTVANAGTSEASFYQSYFEDIVNNKKMNNVKTFREKIGAGITQYVSYVNTMISVIRAEIKGEATGMVLPKPIIESVSNTNQTEKKVGKSLRQQIREKHKTSAKPVESPELLELAGAWFEVKLVLKSPLPSNHSEWLHAFEVIDCGITYFDDLTSLADRLSTPSHCITRSQLLRDYILPFNENTCSNDQSSTTAVADGTVAAFQELINQSGMSLKDGEKITPLELLNGLQKRAVAIRKLIRIKIADEADIKQALEAVQLLHSYKTKTMAYMGMANKSDIFEVIQAIDVL